MWFKVNVFSIAPLLVDLNIFGLLLHGYLHRKSGSIKNRKNPDLFTYGLGAPHAHAATE